MKLNKLWNKRTGVALAALALVACLFLRSTGVREVRRANDPVNFVLVDPKPGPNDWPCWRGTGGTNTTLESAPPLNWSTSENVAWQSAVPGRGHASPCIWGDRIFLPTADSGRQTILLISFDRETGRALWRTELHRGGLMEMHAKNSHASPTAACDGQHVYVANTVKGALWVTAVDFSGRIVWQREAGPYAAKWGYGSSPAIYKSLVIVAADNKGARIDRLVGSSYLAALHRQTGEIVWRIKRTEGDSFGTPIVAHVAGRDQLLLAGKGLVCSYDPATGDPIWTCGWSAERTANTMAFDGQHVFASTRHPQGELICIRADGTGDVTATHVAWREKKSACDVPSPVVHDGSVYSLGDDGILSCLEAETGKIVWKRRLGGNVTASPLIAGDHLYCCNEEGVTFVVRLGGRGEVVAENSLGDGLFASPAVSGDRLYLRTLTGLHCIAAPDTTPVAEKPDDVKRRL